MLKADFTDLELEFLKPSGTSRGILHSKKSWYIKVWDDSNSSIYGLGECGPIKGLSLDPIRLIKSKLKELTKNINHYKSIDLDEYPCIQFGLETALLDLTNGGKKIIYNNTFSNGNLPIYINGLIWMGNKDTMLQQVKSKINQGFRCLKLKIGAINFEEEVSIIKNIRNQFNANDLELRLDANGAFNFKSVDNKLKVLSKYSIHSIEQPISPGEHKQMKKLCSSSPISIALDEELIPVNNLKLKEELISFIKPHYIILKPSLLGGLKKTKEWISVAEKYNIGWWITSALESNIGLNAISQFTAQFNNKLPQGLGTGKIYKNNIPSFLEQKGEYLKVNKNLKWDDSILTFN